MNADGLPAGPFWVNVSSSGASPRLPGRVRNQPIQSPPMGFNSWNVRAWSPAALHFLLPRGPEHPRAAGAGGGRRMQGYHCNIDENIVRKVAQAMVANGMHAAGYDYVSCLPAGTVRGAWHMLVVFPLT
jgi:hypothetical protein